MFTAAFEAGYDSDAGSAHMGVGVVADQGDRADLGGYVHDAGTRGAAQQREHRVRDGDDAQDVGLQDRPEALKRRGAGRAAHGRDARVVHEDVQVAVLRVDKGGRGGDQLAVGDVQVDEAGAMPLGLELTLGVGPPRNVSRPEQHGHPARG